MSEKLVLDSFALVALFHKEPGWQVVQMALYEQEKAHSRAFLNWINWGEFFYVVKRRVGAAKAEEALRRLDRPLLQVNSLVKTSFGQLRNKLFHLPPLRQGVHRIFPRKQLRRRGFLGSVKRFLPHIRQLIGDSGDALQLFQ